MHTPLLLVAPHIKYFLHPRNIDKCLFKRKRRLKKNRKRNRNRTGKRKKGKTSLPPRLGRIQPTSPRALLPSLAAHAAHLPRAALLPPPLTPRPHPSAVLPSHAPATAPSLAGRPRLSAPSPPLARDQATSAFTTGHRPPHLLAINALTNSVGTMRPRSLCPSRPFTPACPSRPVAILRHHHRHGELVGARHPSSLPPSRPPIKGLPRAPCSTTPGLSHSTSLPRAQSSSAPSSLPSPVSSALLSLVAYNQIALALELRLSVASLAHTLSSPIVPSGLAGDFTAASAHHSPWTGHPRHPPVKLTPPP
jgi:hypothetical protein